MTASGSIVFRESSDMASKSLISAFLLIALAQAKDVKVHESGTLLQMNSVECGFDQKSAKSFAGELLGTDSEHRKTYQLLCQEYVLRSDRLDYHIRPRNEKHPVLLPVGGRVQFRMVKDKMRLRIEDLDDKEREYVVVSMIPRTDNNTKTTAAIDRK